MELKLLTSVRLYVVISAMLITGSSNVCAQKHKAAKDSTRTIIVGDSANMKDRGVLTGDNLQLSRQDSLKLADNGEAMKKKRDWSTWAPNPKRALWLAIVLPGAGQIYNRKYWKLPIIYGGIVGCLYAMNWNNQMYKDYSQAYLDIMDDDPSTQSYNSFLHLGTTITSANEETYKNIFKKRKDYYRRYRDLSFFCLIGVYAISIIDAYVDAELSVFDISKDLSMKIRPTTINNQQSRNPLNSTSLGLQCSLNF